MRLGIPIIILDKKLERDESRDDELTKFSKQIQCTYKHFRRLSELRSELVNRLQHVIAEVFINTIRRLPHEGFDTRIKQSLKTAKKVYILSRTPILLFGPRPYLSENKHPDEAEGYELTKQLMEDAISGSTDRELHLVASSCAVLNEIQNQNVTDRAKLSTHVRNELLRYQNIAASTPKFKLACTALSAVPPPHLTYFVTDEEAIIQIKIPGQSSAYCVTTKNMELVFSFKYMIDEYFKLDNQEKFLQQLANRLL